MRIECGLSTGSLGIFIAALLLPGGFAVLAWALYRRFASRGIPAFTRRWQ